MHWKVFLKSGDEIVIEADRFETKHYHNGLTGAEVWYRIDFFTDEERVAVVTSDVLGIVKEEREKKKNDKIEFEAEMIDFTGEYVAHAHLIEVPTEVDYGVRYRVTMEPIGKNIKES